MSSVLQRRLGAFIAGGTITKGQPVKLSSGKVVACAATTDRAIGLAQNAASSGDAIEVALPGGGGFGAAGGTIAEGNLLGFNSSGLLQKVASASDIVIGQAMESAVSGDIFSVNVLGPCQATATQS